MIKKLLQSSAFLITELLFCLNTIKAQDNFIFVNGVGATPLDATSKFRYNAGFGGETGAEIGLTKTTYFVPSIAYISFSGQDTYPTETYIPLKAGIRQYSKSRVVFFDGNIGAGFVSNSVPTQQTPDPSSARFAADIGAGLQLGNVELEINYDTFQEPKPDGWSGWMVFKAGWNIKL
jgi:hypothetical protein